MEPFPKHDNKWYILATTPCRVYQFIGLINPRNEPQFMELFSFYNDQVKGSEFTIFIDRIISNVYV